MTDTQVTVKLCSKRPSQFSLSCPIPMVCLDIIGLASSYTCQTHFKLAQFCGTLRNLPCENKTHLRNPFPRRAK